MEILCQHCNQKLVKRDKESDWHFRKRKFCNQTCVHLSQRKLANIDKKCLQCNTTLQQNHKEKYHFFIERRFCDRTCSNRYHNFKRQQEEKSSVTLTCVRCKQTLPKNNFYKCKKLKRGCVKTCIECYKKSLSYNYSTTIANEGVRNCTICKKEKHVTSFPKGKKYKLGRSSECKDCKRLRLKYKRQNNIEYKIKCNLRSRLRGALKNNCKSTSTLELLGCTISELKIYLQNQFQEKMTWDNHGYWHIDHIKPCASFDLTDPEQQKQCFHYTNLQPLWADDNLKKGGKYV